MHHASLLSDPQPRKNLLWLLVPAFCYCAVQEAHSQDVELTPEGGVSPQIEEITVTGSRIIRHDLSGTQLREIVSGEVLNKRGYVTIAEALNDLAAVGTPDSPRGRQSSGAVGRNYVNLFNLGSQRTLTLVNGRRFVTNNPLAVVNAGSQVDLNNIPSGLIERVEVVHATGSAIYGSDAIAGVVNVILRDDFEGMELDAQYGISSRDDMESYRVRATGGMNFADGRANITASYERSDIGGLLMTDRPFGRISPGYVPNPANQSDTDGIPSHILGDNLRVPEFTFGGLPYVTPGRDLADILRIPDPDNPGSLVPAQFAPDGTLVPYDTGLFQRPAQSIGGDGYQQALNANLLSPVIRNVFFATGHYDINDSLRAFAEISGSWIDSHELAREVGNAVNSGLTGSPGSLSGPLEISVDNPFLTDQARAHLQAAGLSSFYLNRYHQDLLPDGYAQNSRSFTQRYVAGLEGRLEVGERDYHWNVSANRGRTSSENIAYDINQKRFLYGIDAVLAPDGSIACNVTVLQPDSPDPDVARCEPINLFGFGAPSEAAREYLVSVAERQHDLTQTVFQANFGGDLFSLPAGPLSFAAGFEYHKEEARFEPRQALLTGEGRDNPDPVQPISGAYDSNEVYGEVLIPLFGDDVTLPLVERLEIEAAARLIDGSQNGRDRAWNVGARWTPVSGVTFRGSRSRTFRAPAAVELFMPRSAQLSSGLDPCDAQRIDTGANPAVRRANCEALFTSLGLGADYQLVSLIEATPVPSTFGGNPSLENEVANSWTAGIVLQPEFLPGLSFSADWSSIDIEDVIFTFTASSILRTCYDDPNSSPAICNLAPRDAQAQVVSVTEGYINAGYTRFEGTALTLSYDVPAERLGIPGKLALNASAMNTRKLETSVSGLGFDLNVDAGEFNAPEWKAQFAASWSVGKLDAVWFTHYVGEAVRDSTDFVETLDPRGVGSYFRHDLSARWHVNDRVTLRGGIHNVFDRQPPWGQRSLSGLSGRGGSYDIALRSFYLGGQITF